MLAQFFARVIAMIRSLLSFWGTARPDPFKNRNIFSFWDGTKTRHVDPLPILRRMDEAASKEEYNLRIDADALDAGDIHKVDEYAPLINSFFDTQPFSVDDAGKSSGLTGYESLQLLRDFIGWQESLKKNTVAVATTPQPTPATA